MTVDLRLAVALSSVLTLAGASRASAQVVHDRGQNVVPVYEGWERHADGTFTMVFGYFNRNREEEPFVPVGLNNMFEPGDADRGQPTHFYPRRQQFVFKVPLPEDWDEKELVWTLVSNGRTDKAYGSLLPVYEIGEVVYEQNRGRILLHSPSEPVNQPPSIALLSSPRATLTLPEMLNLTVSITDDGLPALPPRRRRRAAQLPSTGRGRPSSSPADQAVVRLEPEWRLGVTWVHYRGPGTVTFDPMRRPVADGETSPVAASASFSEPGPYVLRAYADDGVLTSSVDVTVNVTRR